MRPVVILILLLGYLATTHIVHGAKLTMWRKIKAKGKPTQNPHSGVNNNSGVTMDDRLRCVQCNKCEIGAVITICKADEKCYSNSEISQFENLTYKGCTKDEDFCSTKPDVFPCYICENHVCNAHLVGVGFGEVIQVSWTVIPVAILMLVVAGL